jgi:hypothetical protein
VRWIWEAASSLVVTLYLLLEFGILSYPSDRSARIADWTIYVWFSVYLVVSIFRDARRRRLPRSE